MSLDLLVLFYSRIFSGHSCYLFCKSCFTVFLCVVVFKETVLRIKRVVVVDAILSEYTFKKVS